MKSLPENIGLGVFTSEMEVLFDVEKMFHVEKSSCVKEKSFRKIEVIVFCIIWCKRYESSEDRWFCPLEGKRSLIRAVSME